MRRVRFHILLSAVSCLLMTVGMPQISVLAQMENMSEDEGFPLGDNVGNASDLWLSLVKVIVVLIVIIGLIFIIVKFLAQKNQAWFGRKSVRVLSGVQLAPNKSLQIVEIGNTIYVLGVGEDVNLIDKIHDPEQIVFMKEELTVSHSEKQTWHRFFQGLSRREQQEGDDSSMRHGTFQEIFQQRMSRVAEQHRKMDDLLTDQEEDEKERSKP